MTGSLPPTDTSHTPTDAETPCPKWCARHLPRIDDGPPLHVSEPVAGVDVCLTTDHGETDPPDGLGIYLPQLDWVDAEGARELITGLTAALAIVESETVR